MRRLPLASLSGLLDRVVGEPEGKVDPWERPSHALRVHTIAGDGRCMFRATVRPHTQASQRCQPMVCSSASATAAPVAPLGRRWALRVQARALARQQGKWLSKAEELDEAELLQRACHDALCRKKKSRTYADAWQQIEFGYGGLTPYCRNLKKPGFWGGEVEMMVLTKMLQVPFYVYKPAEEDGGCARALPLALC